MKVLHVIDSLKIGGAESLVASLVPALKERGIESAVCGLGANGPLAERLAPFHCKLFYLDKSLGIRPDVMLQLGKIAFQERCDVIMTHHYRQLFHAVPATVVLRKRLVHIEHDCHSYQDQPGLVGRLSKLAPCVDRFCFVSDEIGDWFAREMPGSVDRMAVIENGIDTDRFAPDEESRRFMRKQSGIGEDAVVFGTCARLEPVKDIKLLLGSFSGLLSGGNSPVRDCQLVIAGDGSLREELEAYAASLGIAGQCHFVGMVDTVPELLSALDIYVITSLNEGLPLSVLEAMSTGLPVVATNVGALDQVINKTVGVLLKGRSPDECAEAMRLLADGAGRSSGMGKRAREFVKDRYSFKSMVDAYVAAIEG